jgi:tetratricopeptide (TPR) repeat protein
MHCCTNKQRALSPAAWAIAVALAGGFAMFHPTAHAAVRALEPPPATDAPDEPAYRKTIEEGLAEYDARHFEEARSLFRRAHEISPNARTFRGIGMTSFELRDYVSAVHNFSAALKDQRKPLSPEQRERTKELLDRSSMFVDVYTLTVSPRNARVIIDGRAPEFEPDGTLMFGFGPHTLEVRAQGMTARSLPINVRGGERKELSVALEPVSAPPPAKSAATPGATAVNPLPQAGSNRGAAAWLWAGGGAALLAGGAGVYWYKQQKQVDSCSNPAPNLRCSNEASTKAWRNAAIGATVGAGAAALTMALIGILSWDSKPAASQSHSALDCVVSPLGIACGRSF